MNSNNFFQLVADFQKNIDWLNQVLKGGENDSVNIDGVIKPSISKDMKDKFDAIRAMVVGRLAYETKAKMEADTSNPNNTLAEVWNDATDANNRLYVWFNGAWHISKYDNFTVLDNEIKDLDARHAALSLRVNSLLTTNDILISEDEKLGVAVRGALKGDADIVHAITDAVGNMAMGVDSEGRTHAHLLRTILGLEFDDNTLLEAGYEDYHLAIADLSDHVIFGIDADGKTKVSDLEVAKNISYSNGEELISGEYNYDFAIADKNGNVGFGFLNGKLISKSTDVAEDLTVLDTKNKISSLSVKDYASTGVQRNVFDYNHTVVYGQSLSTGHEGWPTISRKAMYGNLMLGQAVRPQSGSADGFAPVIDGNLHPLVANVNAGNKILTPEEEAALPPGNGSLGETQNQGWVNFAKKLHNDYFALANDMSRLFVTTNNGVSGRTIEQLSKGASPEIYLRYTQAVDKIKAIADGETKSYGITGISWIQGEYNYTGSNGGDGTKDGYKALLQKLRNDMVEDAKSRTGQADDPAFFTYQTGSSYTRDEHKLGVGMAQWEFAKENRNCFMTGPIYQYPDKGGHLTANSYRWHGNQIAKIYHRVVTLGQDWKPLSPIKIERNSSNSLLVHFHVPEPPLQFGKPYIGTTETDYQAKGFRITNAQGAEISIFDVSIVTDTIIEIKTNLEIPEDAELWYACQATYRGNGCVKDSDKTIAHDSYYYKEGSGQYPEHNIPELVGKPYPLNNWLVAFCLPVEWKE